MGQPAAKEQDLIVNIGDHGHVVGNVRVSFPFLGPLSIGLSSDVRIAGKPAATVNSIAVTKPAHPASSLGTITKGSQTVRINGKAAARDGDSATLCDGQPGKVTVTGTVAATGTVLIGD